MAAITDEELSFFGAAFAELGRCLEIRSSLPKQPASIGPTIAEIGNSFIYRGSDQPNHHTRAEGHATGSGHMV